MNIHEKIDLFIKSVDSMKLPESRGSRLFCMTVDEDQQDFYKELDNIIKGLKGKGESIQNINISELLINDLENDKMVNDIINVEKTSPEFIEEQYRILEKYFLEKIHKRVNESTADIIVITRVEFTYPYIKNAFRIMMEFENEFNKAVLMILPAEKKADNLYKYLNKVDISSPSFRIKDITTF